MPEKPPLSRISGLNDTINDVHGETLRLAARLYETRSDSNPTDYSILASAVAEIVELDELLAGGQIHRVIWGAAK